MPKSAQSSASIPTKRRSAPQLALERLGLRRPIDLALHVPLRYEDETQIQSLSPSLAGQTVQFIGVVVRNDVAYRPRRQLQVTVQDGEYTCKLRFFNFYGNQQKMMAVGRALRVRGELKANALGLEMVHPSAKPAEEAVPQTLTPVYPTTAGLPQAYLRKAVVSALARCDWSETVPEQSWAALGGARWGLSEALHHLHQPPPETLLSAIEDRTHPAWTRLKAEELLAQQLAQWKARQERDSQHAPVLSAPMRQLSDALLAQLPFALTDAQARVCQEIEQDLARHMPMNRLLQGDVGAGKTVVAALAACIAMESGWQCALMAPTEILAEQHFQKLIQWMQPVLQRQGRQVAWLVGTQKKKEREAMLQAVRTGEAALVVGTHALIQDSVAFRQLGLVIVDEQHRFGVEQRLTLRRKLSRPDASGGRPQEPHMLMMTATPIPRTLAMTLYADLDVSVLDELPPGRTPVVTRTISNTRRPEVMQRIVGQIEAGRQAYWVCPLIEDSEALDLQSATQAYAQLCEVLGQPPCESVLHAPTPPKAALLHARLQPAEKKAIMAEFAAGRIGVLVSTTVIEVGVDVPNASLMVIEHAERFGLSQLHQLRGRVGRGAQASACVLLYGPQLGAIAKQRLQAMVHSNDGFELARIDLSLRGPGEFLGAKQSGAALLRFADLEHDGQLLDWAREQAPCIWRQSPAMAKDHIERWLGAKTEFMKA